MMATKQLQLNSIEIVSRRVYNPASGESESRD